MEQRDETRHHAVLSAEQPALLYIRSAWHWSHWSVPAVSIPPVRDGGKGGGGKSTTIARGGRVSVWLAWPVITGVTMAWSLATNTDEAAPAIALEAWGAVSGTSGQQAVQAGTC